VTFQNSCAEDIVNWVFMFSIAQILSTVRDSPVIKFMFTGLSSDCLCNSVTVAILARNSLMSKY
jgi:hypothetical protein